MEQFPSIEGITEETAAFGSPDPNKDPEEEPDAIRQYCDSLLDAHV
jgi:hypothetical protein